MHQKVEFSFSFFYLLPPHHCFFDVLLAKHILTCLQRKGKAKLEKRREKNMKDLKKTINLIKGGMLVGVCMWVCICICMLHFYTTVPKS